MRELNRGPTAVREVFLADRPEQVPADVPWTAFGDCAGSAGETLPLADFARSEEGQLRRAFIDWAGALNMEHASPEWWAHTTSAKNLLSSPFGNQVLELLAFRRLIERTAEARVAVVGATPAQREVIASMGAKAGAQVAHTGLPARSALLPLARVGYQFLRILLLWPWLRRFRAATGADVHIVTYGDEGLRDRGDAFFGTLSEQLAKREPPLDVLHHVFVQGRYSRILPRIRAARHYRYAPLFAELRLSDLCAALASTLRAWAKIDRTTPLRPLEGLDLSPVLRAALRWDTAKGGYFYNVLVHRAARRLGERLKPALLLYPYEAKSLEKLLLLGLRATHPVARTAGYQHSAITPRHATLLFAPGEADRTPLPDRIITVGAVTHRYLAEHGRYPGGLLHSGFALRQTGRAMLPRRRADDTAHVLFALSSSVRELAAAARCVLELARHRPDWRIAIRPHPEFPLRRLPGQLAADVRSRALDLAGTRLDDNLKWCDVVVYASSTVALEALMAGRPVVNFDAGDLLPVDPVVEPLVLHARARNAGEVAQAVERFRAMEADAFSLAAEAARGFTGRYFPPPSAEGLELFIRVPGQPGS